MKKIKAVFIIVLITSFCYAEPTSSKLDILSSAQLKLYNRSRLSVEIEQSELGYINLDAGLMMSETYNRWQGYKGFGIIDESSFFRIAGYEEEAIEAEKYIESADSLLLGGCVLVIGGVATMLASLLIMPRYNDPQYSEKMDLTWTLLWVGTGVGIIGAIPCGIGFDMSMQNWAPYNQAVSVADEYNSGLYDEILKGDN